MHVAKCAEAALDYGAFVAHADRIAPRFAAVTADLTEVAHASILFSDGLCICALGEMFEIDALVEAGTGCGGSTEMFARYFEAGRLPGGITSIDLAYTAFSTWWRTRLRMRDRLVFTTRWAQNVARERLGRYEHVTLLHGDAHRLMPRVVRRLVRQGLRVGLFIDGPKREPQLRLAHTCLRLSPLVCFAALDDIGPRFDAGERHAHFRSSPYAAFSTSDAEYFSRYSWVNGDRYPGNMGADPINLGYGVGVLVNAVSWKA
jgi:hypothetical protein